MPKLYKVIHQYRPDVAIMDESANRKWSDAGFRD